MCRPRTKDVAEKKTNTHTDRERQDVSRKQVRSIFHDERVGAARVPGTPATATHSHGSVGSEQLFHACTRRMPGAYLFLEAGGVVCVAGLEINVSVGRLHHSRLPPRHLRHGLRAKDSGESPKKKKTATATTQNKKRQMNTCIHTRFPSGMWQAEWRKTKNVKQIYTRYRTTYLDHNP